MLQRRQIRVLVPYSKTLYFVDKGQPRGLAHDVFKLFEEDLNKHLKKGHVKVHVVFKPSARGDLIQELQEGYGDVAMGIPDHHPRATEGNRLHEPDGQERLGDRRHDGRPAAAELPAGSLRPGGVPPQGILVLRRASRSSTPSSPKAGKPPVTIRAAPEVLADEDILEMVNAGLVDDDGRRRLRRASSGSRSSRRSSSTAAPRSGPTARRRWMIRKNSPQLKAELNAFLARYPEGSLQRKQSCRRST